MEKLLTEIRNCTVCQQYLPCKPRPVVQASDSSKIIVIGQAPGIKVQASGIPWDDRSGMELRRWLGVTNEQFFNDKIFAFIPMGFCYPGSGVSGDLPPRLECAPLWHERLMEEMEQTQLTILVGLYAQKYYLKKRYKENLTTNIHSYQAFLPHYFPVVHPSPRNKTWQKKNPWFEQETIPALQKLVRQILLQT